MTLFARPALRLTQSINGLFKSLLIASLLFSAQAMATELNLYTTREPGLMQPLLTAFTAETGIKVNTIFLKDGLAERVANEGQRSPADVLMAVDFGLLTDLAERGLTQPVDSPVLKAAVPAALRHAEDHWFALSMRARVFYLAQGLEQTRFTYEDLADPKWKGAVCIRSGQHPYNIGLISHMIAKHGEAKTEQWLRGVKANLARKAAGGDREVARDIMGGLCDIGPANSYYVGLMRSGAGGEEQKRWGAAIDVALPTFVDGGTHVNISGAAVAKYAPNRDNAVRLLEYLVSDEAQAIYARANFEFPVKAGAEIDPLIAAFGELTVDKLVLSQVAAYRKTASLLVDKVRFDD